MKTLKEMKNIFILLIVGILAISALFRFYNLQQWTSFGMDQEYQAYIAKNIASGAHFPLIGVNASDTGLYLGPFFSYFTALTYVLFHGDPVGWSAVASLWGVITTLSVIVIARKMFSGKVAIFAGIFYAGSFLVSFYERQYWNPMLIPFLSLLTGFFLYKFAKKQKNSLVQLSFVFALALQCHLSILVFLPVILYFIFRYRRFVNKKEFAISISVLLLSFAPIILFDIRHNFQNLSSLINLILNAHGIGIQLLESRITQFISLIGRIIWVPFFPDLSIESGQCKELANFIKSPNLEAVLAGLVLLFSFLYVFFLQHRNDHNYKIVFSIFASTLAVIIFYNRSVFEYYYLYLFPWFSIAFALGLSHISDKEHGIVVSTFILFVFVGLNLGTLFTAQKTFSYPEKIQAVQYVNDSIGNTSYILEAVGECEKFGGYRYLFDHYFRPPQQSYMDPYFSWLYSKTQHKVNNPPVVLLSLIDPRSPFSNVGKIEEEKLKYLTDYTQLQTEKFNSIYVYILAPKSP